MNIPKPISGKRITSFDGANVSMAPQFFKLPCGVRKAICVAACAALPPPAAAICVAGCQAIC